MMIFIIWTYTGQENKIVQQTCLNITVHTLYRTLPHLRWKWRQCTGENSVELTKDFKLTISFQKRILAGYWLNFTFLAAVFRPVLDHPLLLCFSTPILILHHFSSLALAAFSFRTFLLQGKALLCPQLHQFHLSSQFCLVLCHSPMLIKFILSLFLIKFIL